MNLLNDPWIPVRRGDDPAVRMATLAEVTAGGCHGPHWGRPDLDVATIELLVGLASLAWQPKDGAGVRAARRADQSGVVARLAPHAAAFRVDGSPGFLQDLAELDEPWVPASRGLFLDSGSAFSPLPDHPGPFVLSRAAAAVALHAVQSHSLAGGRGHRTGLRGGGPLVTIVVPQDPDGGEPDLWDVAMANLTPMAGSAVKVAADPRVFPWMAPTLSSGDADTAAHVHERDARVHPMQVWWGMPRRVNLRWVPNADRVPCALTGVVDDVVADAYRSRHGGVNYGDWSHPLTPYRKGTGNSRISLKPTEARTTFSDRAGVVYGSPRNGVEPALAVVAAVRDAMDANGPPPRVLVAGHVADNAKAVSYRLEVVPVTVARDADALEAAQAGIDAMAMSTAAIAGALRQAVGRATFPEWDCANKAKRSKVRKAMLPYGAVATLHALLDDDFSRRAEHALRTGSDPLEARPEPDRRPHWRDAVAWAVRDVFGRHVPSATLANAAEAHVARIVSARSALAASLAGYTPQGKDFLKAMGIAPPARGDAPATDGEREAA